MALKELKNIFEGFASRHPLYDVFCDFLTLSANSIRCSCDFNNREKAHEEYLKVAKKYTRDELKQFANAFGALAISLEEKPRDVLGELYMSLGLGNKWTGQFFTPYHLSLATARVALSDIDNVLENKNFIIINEPSVGGGGMIIAAFEVIKEKGYNPQQKMLADCTDLDIKSVYMTYIQLSLLGVPAIVRHGNTISLEEFDRMITTAYLIDGWAYKKQKHINQVAIRVVSDGQMMIG